MKQLQGGREERTGERDPSMSIWLRTMRDCPFADLDFVGLVFDQLDPAALIDWKHVSAEDHYQKTSGPSLEAIRRLANRGTPLPFFVVFYSDGQQWFAVVPMNTAASNIVGQYTRMSARALAAFLYGLSGRTAPQDVLDGLPDAAPPQKFIGASAERKQREADAFDDFFGKGDA